MCLLRLDVFPFSYLTVLSFVWLFLWLSGIMMSDVEMLKEAFKNPAVTGRKALDPYTLAHNGKMRGKNWGTSFFKWQSRNFRENALISYNWFSYPFQGFLGQSGEAWREIRKFTVTQLKEFGFGTRSLEPMIEEEAEELILILRSQVNTPFRTEMFFNLPAFNVLW